MSGLPKRNAFDPLRGYKSARLIHTADGYRLGGLGQLSAAYGVEANAECVHGTRRHHKPPPHPLCSCGFYAWKRERPTPFLHPGDGVAVNLVVDLYGKVIVHTYGYRAAHQRVVQAELLLPTLCGAVTARDMVEVTTFGDTFSKYLPGAPSAWCGRTATHLCGGTSMCDGHERLYGDAVPLDAVIDKVRADLPTDWTLHLSEWKGIDERW